MAKPIKNTPVLKGQDAINFSKVIKRNSNRKISSEEVLAIKGSAKLLKKFFGA